nr:hypothetical protein CPGR_00640 [Mycolicibacterium malmesburyense]
MCAGASCISATGETTDSQGRDGTITERTLVCVNVE